MRVSQELNNNYGIAKKILHLLESYRISQSHLLQIQAQIIVNSLLPDTTVAHHFISTSQSLGLLSSAFLLYTVNFYEPHVYVYNQLLRAFSHSQDHQASVFIYSRMRAKCLSPNNYTFPFIMKSLSDLRSLKQGQCLHSQIVKMGHLGDVYVSNSLLNLYSSCGNMRLCKCMFDEMPIRDVVSWTVLISGYRASGKFNDALIALNQMQNAGVEPNRVTMVNALAACGPLGALDRGVWIHDFIKMRAWPLDVILGTSLIDMYGKCGKTEEALEVFQSMEQKNVFTWNALIKGFALAKSGNDAVCWFLRMKDEGVKPDEVTLTAVLCGCVHSYLVERGWEIFSTLVDRKYGFSPGAQHYACMVDMLARSGCLEDAKRIIEKMPFKATNTIWGAFLSGCIAHGKLELAEFAACKLVELEPENCTYYVVLSNLYAEIGKWGDVERIRKLVKEKELKKDSGNSTLEHQFDISRFLSLPNNDASLANLVNNVRTFKEILE